MSKLRTGDQQQLYASDDQREHLLLGFLTYKEYSEWDPKMAIRVCKQHRFQRQQISALMAALQDHVALQSTRLTEIGTGTR